MEKPKLIPPHANLAEGEPNPDVFDPYAWYEGTGEDLGLPEGYVEKKRAALEESRRWVAEQLAKQQDEPTT